MAELNFEVAACMIADDNAIKDGIENALKSLKAQGVQSAYVSFNGKSQRIADQIWDMLREHFKHCTIADDSDEVEFSFSVARNRSFALAVDSYGKNNRTLDWLIWLDCDDTWEGSLEKSLQELTKRRAHYALVPYQYDTHVSHPKERIFRADVQWRWVYPIHEVCEGPISVRSINDEHSVVTHNRKGAAEKQQRNYDAINRWFTAEKENPRAQMFMAHALAAQLRENKDWDEKTQEIALNSALKLYRHFIEEVGSTDDAYTCLVQMAGLFVDCGEDEKAQDSLLQAVKIRPLLPMAKAHLAEIAFRAGDYDNARDWCHEIMGLDAHDLMMGNVVSDLRDVEDIPQRILRDIQQETNDLFGKHAKEKHDALMREHQDDEDSVCIFTQPSAEVWNFKKVFRAGSGGTEMQVLRLAQSLAGEGRRVVLYGTVGTDADGTIENGVELYDTKRFHPDNKFGTFIAVRSPEMLSAPMKVKKKILWLHDVNVGEVDPGTFAEADEIVVPSAWLGQRTIELYGLDSGHKVTVIPNGVLWTIFNEKMKESKVKRDTNKIVYASSPDRGLLRLLQMWPEILEQIPNATLDIYYGWDGIDAIIEKKAPHAEQMAYFKEKIQAKIRSLNEQHGQRILWKGRVSEETLTSVFPTAGAMAYPANFNETFGIVFQQAMAAGLPPVVSQMGALKDLIPRWLQVPGSPDSESFTQPFIDTLKLALSSHEGDHHTFEDGEVMDFQHAEEAMSAQANRCNFFIVHNAWKNIVHTSQEKTA